MRRHNLALALRTIWDSGQITRTGLAERLELSKPAITRIVNDLVQAGYVSDTEDRPASGRGRPSSYLRLTAGRHYFVGIDLRVDRLAIQARDLSGAVLSQRHFPVARGDAAEVVVASLGGRIHALMAERGGPPSGIGVSVPAQIDDGGRMVLNSTYFDWRDVPFPALLRQAVGPGCPAIRISDVSGCAAIANWREIAGTGAADLAHVQIGVGAGVGLAGRSFPTDPGSHRLFHRFGHLPMDRYGPRCKCGAPGCLDAVAGFDALVRYAAPCGLTAGSGPDAMNGFCAALLACQEAGSADAARAIETAAGWFGRATAAVINIVNPSHVTIAGYPLQLGAPFMAAFRVTLEAYAPGGAALLTRTSLGDEASVAGAVLLGMHAAMSDPLGTGAATGG
jgi:predicted NBD/HSP70 family sugar kinase